jgi:hypothetical protein
MINGFYNPLTGADWPNQMRQVGNDVCMVEFDQTDQVIAV